MARTFVRRITGQLANFRSPPLSNLVIPLAEAAPNATAPSRPAHILHCQNAERDFYNLFRFDGRAEGRCDLGLEVVPGNSDTLRLAVPGRAEPPGNWSMINVP